LKNIKITEHGVKLLDELQKIREAFKSSNDLSLDTQNQLADAYLAKATPYETQIIEEIFDANNNQTRKS
tara:strand:+ start:329 stop:535 length:207 start_codon:yes stop_codon:yes gene_type:complete